MRAASQTRVSTSRKGTWTDRVQPRRRSPAMQHGDGLVPFLIAGALFGLLIAIAGPAHSGLDFSISTAPPASSSAASSEPVGPAG